LQYETLVNGTTTKQHCHLLESTVREVGDTIDEDMSARRKKNDAAKTTHAHRKTESARDENDKEQVKCTATKSRKKSDE